METSNPDYLKWKKKHELEKQQDRKKLITRGILVFGGIIFISALVYFWSIGSFQFIGSETKEVRASNIIVNDYHIGRGNYIPRLTIEYTHESKVYKTYENIRKSPKRQLSEGDGTIYVDAFITFDIDNPENCRVRLVFE